MKQHDVKQERIIGNNIFYVRPFSAFKAANLSGEVFSLLMPIIIKIAPLVLNARKKGKDDESDAAQDDETSALDIEAEEAAPHLANAASGISGDKLEVLLKKLLVENKNISVELEGEKEAQFLDKDIADEIFCGDVQDMFILAFDVIKVNYNGFFKKLGGQYGKALNAFLAKG